MSCRQAFTALALFTVASLQSCQIMLRPALLSGPRPYLSAGPPAFDVDGVNSFVLNWETLTVLYLHNNYCKYSSANKIWY